MLLSPITPHAISLRLYTAVLVAAGTYGCAAQRMDIEPVRFGAQLRAPSGSGAARPTMAMGQFEDSTAASDPFIIGVAKTGFFNQDTPIHSSQTPAQQVEAALRQAFADLGFRVGAPGEAEYTVHGVVRRFWVDEYTTGDRPEYSRAMVRYDLFIANRNGDIVWVTTAEGRRLSFPSRWDTTAGNRQTLAEALDESLDRVFRADDFWRAVATDAR